MARNPPRSNGYSLDHPDAAYHLLESLPGPGLLCDEQDTVRGWNQRALTAFGLAGNRLSGRSLPGLFKGAQSERFTRELARTRSQGMGEVSLPFQIPDGPSPRFTFRLMALRDDARNWVMVTVALADAPSEETEGPARALLNQHPYGLLVLHTYRVSYANPASSELLGYTEARALTGLPLSALVYDPDRVQMGNLLDRALHQKSPQDRLRLRDRNGGPLDMEICLTLLEGSRTPTLQVVFRPVSQDQGIEHALRKHEERQWQLLRHALRDSEDRIREAVQAVGAEQADSGISDGSRESEPPRPLLDALSEGFLETDGEGRARNLNPAMLVLLDRNRDDVLGRPLSDFLPSEEVSRVDDHLRRAGPQEAVHTRLNQGNGRMIPVRLKSASPRGAYEEHACGRALFFTDLSPQQALREQLRRRTQVERSIFESFPGVVWMARNDLSLSYWNQQVHEETGWDTENLAAMYAEDLIEPANRKAFRAMLYPGSGPGATTFLETRLTAPRGRTGLFRLYPVPLSPGETGENGESLAILGLQADENPDHLTVTDRTEGPGGFMYMLRHEINRSQRYANPLSLLAVGIDDLPEIRKRYGEATAEKVRIELEALLRASARTTDQLMQGEDSEFFLLAPETGREKARLMEERFKRLIHQHDFDPVAWVYPLVGYATYRSGETAEDLLGRARQAMARTPMPDNENGVSSRPG